MFLVEFFWDKSLRYMHATSNSVENRYIYKIAYDYCYFK